MKALGTLSVLLLLAFASPAPASQSPRPPVDDSGAVTVNDATRGQAQENVTAYTLPPDLYKKAHDLGRIRFGRALIGFVYGLVVLWLILRLNLAAMYRAWAERFSTRRFVQSVVFSPLLLLTTALLTLPLDLYGEWIEKKYGLSVQGWGSWSWDWVKAQLIALGIGTILIWLLYLVIRRSPHRWWFYFWVVSVPILLFLLFLGPWVFDPMFHKFEPLQEKAPVLTASLEQMVRRAGEDIPPQRMFWMGAAEKTTGLNAYVAGFGASKRIVVWDTTISKMTTPQIVYVAGHEMGHYVLQHIPKMLAIFAVLLLILFYFGFRSIHWVLDHWGSSWGIRGLGDWASLPALLLLSVFLFLATPIFSTVSRYYERQADQYGLEVTHGLNSNFGQTAAQGFQILGEVNLADPDPIPAAVFMYYDHPPIADRVRFCLTYDPWAGGGTGEFVK